MSGQFHEMAIHWYVYIVLELLEITRWLTLTVACYNVLQPQLVTPDKIK